MTVLGRRRAEPTGQRFAPWLRALLFFVLVALSTKRAVSSWNDAARMATIQSLVEQRTLAIDNSIFVDLTADKYVYEGRQYSSKPPLLAIGAAPIYWGLRTLGITFDQQPAWSYYFVTLLSVGLVSALGVGLMWHVLVEAMGVGMRWADVTVLLTALGTLFLPFSTVFNSHTVSAVLILAGFILALKAAGDGPWRSSALSGLAFAAAAAIDPSLAVFLPIGFLIVVRATLREGAAFIAAAAPVLLLALVLNLSTSGSPLPPTLNEPLRDYPGSEFRQQELSGLAGHDDLGDVLVYGFHSTVGNRGLFSHSPVLLLALGGALLVARRRGAHTYAGAFAWLGLGMILYFGAYLLRTSNYSGEAFGVRWFASLMLVMGLPLGVLENEVRRSPTLRYTLIVVGAVSIGLSVLGSYRPFLPVAELVAGEPGVVDNTIVAAWDRFVRLASPEGQLRTAALALLSLALYVGAVRRWSADAPD